MPQVKHYNQQDRFTHRKIDIDTIVKNRELISVGINSASIRLCFEGDFVVLLYNVSEILYSGKNLFSKIDFKNITINNNVATVEKEINKIIDKMSIESDKIIITFRDGKTLLLTAKSDSKIAISYVNNCSIASIDAVLVEKLLEIGIVRYTFESLDDGEFIMVIRLGNKEYYIDLLEDSYYKIDFDIDAFDTFDFDKTYYLCDQVDDVITFFKEVKNGNY